MVVAFRVTVIDPVGLVNRGFCAFIKDVGAVHIIRKETYLHFHSDELHGNIIRFLEDGDGGIISYLACDTVIETVIQPFTGQRMTDVIAGILKTCHRGRVNAGMIGSVVFSYIIIKHLIKLLKRMYLSCVDGVDPGGLHTEPLSLRFSLAGAIPNFCMDKAYAEGNTDHGELLI